MHLINDYEVVKNIMEIRCSDILTRVRLVIAYIFIECDGIHRVISSVCQYEYLIVEDVMLIIMIPHA